MSEVFNILRVNQILFCCILAVVLLEVMNLILVLVIAVMSRSIAQIWELEALRVADREFGEGNRTREITVKDCNDLVNGCGLFRLGDVLRGRVLETIRFKQVVFGPFVAAVVVVQVEERTGIEGGDVMFLW